MSDNNKIDGVDNIKEKYEQIIDTFNQETELMKNKYEKHNENLITDYMDDINEINISYKKKVNEIEEDYEKISSDLKKKRDLFNKLKPLTEEKYERDIKSLNDSIEFKIEKFSSEKKLEEVNKIDELNYTRKNRIKDLESRKTDFYDKNIEKLNADMKVETDKVEKLYDNKFNKILEEKESKLELLKLELKKSIDENNKLYSDDLMKIDEEYKMEISKINELESKNNKIRNNLKEEFDSEVEKLTSLINESNKNNFNDKIEKAKADIILNDSNYNEKLREISMKMVSDQKSLNKNSNEIDLIEQEIQKISKSLENNEKSLVDFEKSVEIKNYNKEMNDMQNEYKNNMNNLKSVTTREVNNYINEQRNIFKTKFDSDRKSLDLKLKNIEEEFESYQNQLKKKIDEIKIIISQIDQQNTDNIDNLKKYETDYNMIKEKSPEEINLIRDLEKRITEENILETKDRFIDSFQKKYNEDKEKIGIVLTEKIDEEIKANKIIVDFTNSQIDSLEQQKNTINNDKETFQIEINNNLKDIENLESKLTKLSLEKKSKTENLQKNIEDEVNKTFTPFLNKKNQEIENLSNEFDEKSKQAKIDLKNLEENNSPFDILLSNEENQIKSINEQIISKNIEISELNQQITSRENKKSEFITKMNNIYDKEFDQEKSIIDEKYTVNSENKTKEIEKELDELRGKKANYLILLQSNSLNTEGTKHVIESINSVNLDITKLESDLNLAKSQKNLQVSEEKNKDLVSLESKFTNKKIEIENTYDNETELIKNNFQKIKSENIELTNKLKESVNNIEKFKIEKSTSIDKIKKYGISIEEEKINSINEVNKKYDDIKNKLVQQETFNKSSEISENYDKEIALISKEKLNLNEKLKEKNELLSEKESQITKVVLKRNDLVEQLKTTSKIIENLSKEKVYSSTKKKEEETKIISELEENIKNTNQISETQLKNELKEIDNKYNKDKLKNQVNVLREKTSNSNQVLSIQNQSLQSYKQKLSETIENFEKEIKDEINEMNLKYINELKKIEDNRNLKEKEISKKLENTYNSSKDKSLELISNKYKNILSRKSKILKEIEKNNSLLKENKNIKKIKDDEFKNITDAIILKNKTENQIAEKNYNNSKFELNKTKENLIEEKTKRLEDDLREMKNRLDKEYKLKKNKYDIDYSSEKKKFKDAKEARFKSKQNKLSENKDTINKKYNKDLEDMEKEFKSTNTSTNLEFVEKLKNIVNGFKLKIETEENSKKNLFSKIDRDINEINKSYDNYIKTFEEGNDNEIENYIESVEKEKILQKKKLDNNFKTTIDTLYVDYDKESKTLESEHKLKYNSQLEFYQKESDNNGFSFNQEKLKIREQLKNELEEKINKIKKM